VQHFASGNFEIVLRSLKVANSILNRYRNVFKTDQVLIDLKFILTTIQEPLLQLNQKVTQIINESRGNAKVLANCFRAQILITKIFFSLNFVDLPAYFEDHMEEWMGLFLIYLEYETTEGFFICFFILFSSHFSLCYRFPIW
jgi:exportin-2 (importin alpha re-exporter)